MPSHNICWELRGRRKRNSRIYSAGGKEEGISVEWEMKTRRESGERREKKGFELGGRV
jgi:hypothetical protein